MLERAGYESVAKGLDAKLVAQKVDEVETSAREMAVKEHNTVTHNRGTDVFEAGAVRFGLEMRDLGFDGGLAIHVLGDVAGQEIELLAFDCFRGFPHYHYGPRNENERIYWDKTTVPDTLAWTLEQFKTATRGAITEREELDQLRGAVSGAIVRRKVEDQKVRQLTNRVINGIKASPQFGPDSDLNRRLGYVTDIERSSGLKRDGTGDSASPNP